MEILGINLPDGSLLTIGSWLLLGLIVGIIAGIIDPQGVKGGVISTIIIGLLGALVGGYLASNLLGISVTGFNLVSILVSVAGALLLVVVYRLLFKEEKHIKTSTVKK